MQIIPPLSRIHAVSPLVRTSGTLSQNSTTWADVDPSGTSSARDLDVVIPAAVGDIIYVAPTVVVGVQATDLYFDMATIVTGAVVNTFSGFTTGGLGGWFCPTSVVHTLTGPAHYVVQSGDISGGNVRCRLRYKTGSATNRNVYADSATWPFKIGGGNLGPPA